MSHLLARAGGGGGECAHHKSERAVEHPRSRRRMEKDRDRREREGGEGAVTGHHDADAGERRKEGGREE